MAEKKAALQQKVKVTKQIAKEESYVCEVCGLAIVVDEACDCVDTCDIICCDQPMKKKKTKAKTVKK